MKNRRESKLAAKIDKSDKKQRATKEKITKKQKRSGKDFEGVRPIAEDLSSQYEESEDELERVSRGPN
ncbi:MAG: hypothetical protein ACYCQJ_01920 [Nitrososphaerales archaeon]